MRTCAACGKLFVGGIQIGGTLLCQECATDIELEMQSLRESGQPVNVRHIARRKFREVHSAGEYLLRDIPKDLWAEAKHRTIDEGCSLRELIFKALREYLAK